MNEDLNAAKSGERRWRFSRGATSLDRRQQGFTLLELLVVLVILASASLLLLLLIGLSAGLAPLRARRRQRPPQHPIGGLPAYVCGWAVASGSP